MTNGVHQIPDTKITAIQIDPKFCSKTSQIQLLYGLWVNITQFGIGLAFGFVTVQVSQLLEIDSQITITHSDASWIASVLPLFCSIGCLISGFLMDRFGRRFMLIYCQVPTFIGWLCTGLARTPLHIIIGRAITGIGCGMSMGPPRIFCSEISLPNMRGMIGAFPAIAFAVGVTVQAGLGKYLHWEVVCHISCFFSFVNFCLFHLLPETPYYVLVIKTAEEARVNLMKFRSASYNLDNEMEQLIEFKRENDIRKLTWTESIQALYTCSSCKPFSVIIIYMFFSQAAGVTCVYMWSIEMLMLAKSSFDPYTGNILMAITRLVMCVVTSILIYRVGRRSLAIASAIGVTVISLALGFYLMKYEEPSLVPLICLLLYMAYASIGYYPLPMLVSSELYPLQVRGILNGATVCLTCLMMFGSTNLCQYMMDFFGLAYTFLIFGVFSFLGTVFLFFYLPETKDLTLQEIEEYYRERRPTLVSQRRVQSLSLLKMATVKNRFGSEKRSRSNVPSTKKPTHKSEAKKQLDKLLGRNQSSSNHGDPTKDDSPQGLEAGAVSRSITFTKDQEDKDKPSTSKKNT